MTAADDLLSVELLRIKSSTFALVFKDQTQNEELVKEVIHRLPKCCFDKKRLQNITNSYADIKDGMNFSLEDIYSILSIDIENSSAILSNYKRQCIKSYRQHILKILDKTKTQIQINADKVRMSQIARTIFKKSQDYNDEKPRFVANLWFLGNSHEANTMMRKAFEHYALASPEQRENQQFCADRLVELMTAYERSVTDSFRIHYLDHVIDQIYNWYFVEPEQNFDFLIFVPDIFDDIRDYLLDILDKNPFCLYLKEVDGLYEKIEADETCLDSDSLIFMLDADFSEVTCLRQLHRMYNEYHEAHRAFIQYGVFTCDCHDISHLVSGAFSKTPHKRSIEYHAISNLLNEDNRVITHENMLYDRQKFIRHVIKPHLTHHYLNQMLDV